DKAEDLLADYLKKYGNYFLTGDPIEKLGLSLLMKEMQNVSKLYDSHRLYMYHSCMLIFHRLFVEQDDMAYEGEAIEDIFVRVQKNIFDRLAFVGHVVLLYKQPVKNEHAAVVHIQPVRVIQLRHILHLLHEKA